MEQERIDLDALGVKVQSWSGTDNAMCICVFHEERNASMSVNVVKGVYNCFSCGSRGSVNKIAKRTGGVVSKKLESLAPKDHDSSEWQRFLETPLAYGDEYLVGRGVTDLQVEKFQIKDHSWGIAFPLQDEFNDVCGVLLRYRNPSHKPRYQLFGDVPPIWPISGLERTVFVTEGVFGVLSADRAELPAVATLSASLRKETVFSLLASRLYIIFDDDKAGYLGAAKLRVTNPEAHVITQLGLEVDKFEIKDWLKLRESIEDGSIIFTNTNHELSLLYGDEAEFYRNLSAFLNKLKEWMS